MCPTYNMSITYLQNNKVKYTNANANANANYVVLYNNGVTTESTDMISYNNDTFSTIYYKLGLTPEVNNSSTFTLLQDNTQRSTCTLIVSARPTFLCSNFFAINDTSSITFSIQVTTCDNQTVTSNYAYALNKDFMNTINFFQVVKTTSIKSFKLTAQSNIILWLFKPNKYTDAKHTNCAVVYV